MQWSILLLGLAGMGGVAIYCDRLSPTPVSPDPPPAALCQEHVWYADQDDDGHGDQLVKQSACTQPTGYVSAGNDCDDAYTVDFPGAPEKCDGRDNDCDQEVDDGCHIGVVIQPWIRPDPTTDKTCGALGQFTVTKNGQAVNGCTAVSTPSGGCEIICPDK